MANNNIAKTLPHSIESEQSILGCCLIDEEAPISAMGDLKEDDFYTDAHKKIFATMHTIYAENKPIDFVTLIEKLEKQNQLDEVGGVEYITALTNSIPSAVNYKAYIELVKKNSVLRKIITAGQKIIEAAYDDTSKEDAIMFAEKQIYDIAEKEDKSSLEQIEPALNDVITKLDTIAKDKDALKGIITGYSEFDKVTNGLQNSDLILLAARPGVGKTSFAMNIINYAATKGKKHCAVFSLEMPRVQIAQRSLFSNACVSMEKGLKGELSIEEWKSIWATKKQLDSAEIYIDDSSMNTAMDILSKCRRLKREKGLDLVMIDYLQLMNGHGKGENRQQEISEITRALKIAAKELNVPIIVLSQLSRALEARKDHRPILADLRESGSIEQDADIVVFIYNPMKYNDVVSEDEPGVCEIIIAKHRNGPLATVKLRWVGEYTKFVNINDQTYQQSYSKPKATSEQSQPVELEELPASSLENIDSAW